MLESLHRLLSLCPIGNCIMLLLCTGVELTWLKRVAPSGDINSLASVLIASTTVTIVTILHWHIVGIRFAGFYYCCATIYLRGISAFTGRSAASSPIALFRKQAPMNRGPSVGRGRAESTECRWRRRGFVFGHHLAYFLPVPKQRPINTNGPESAECCDTRQTHCTNTCSNATVVPLPKFTYYVLCRYT